MCQSSEFLDACILGLDRQEICTDKYVIQGLLVMFSMGKKRQGKGGWVEWKLCYIDLKEKAL